MTTTARQRAVARRHYRFSRTLSLAGMRAAIRAWRRLDPGAISRSWTAEGVGPELYSTLFAAKRRAAAEATPYLDDLLGERTAPGQFRVRPEGWADEAADGRRLDRLLMQPAIQALAGQRNGAPPREAMRAGEVSLARLIQSEIQAAGRSADQVEMAIRPRVTGYTRLLSPPSCGRCVILAGRFYRWSEGFERHPNCDCIHVPATEEPDSGELVDAVAAVRAGQVNGLSRADEAAILAGADPSQVINAHSGMYSLDGLKYTRAGTTRRGLAGQRLGGGRRLRPEAIFRIAGGDRPEALRLLYQNGFII